MYITKYKDFSNRQKASLRRKMRSFLRNLVFFSLPMFSDDSDECFIRCIFCHYVFDDQVDAFRNIMTSLLKVGSFISTTELSDFITGKNVLDGKYFHLSFDDGLRNNYTNAVPVLSELSIPATFFVPTQIIGADFNKSVKYCVETIKYPGPVEILKLSDVEDMISLKFEIASHTRTHACINTQDTRMLIDEIEGSKRDLENQLGVECKYISWPFGEALHINEKAFDIIKQAGYEMCFSAIRGQVIPGHTDRFSIPRHYIALEMPERHIKLHLSGHFEKS